MKRPAPGCRWAGLLGLAGGFILMAGCANWLHWPRPSGPGTYVVRPGDTLYSIAWRYRLDYRRVAARNGIGPPYLIYPGERIRLHGARPVPLRPTRRMVRPPPLAQHRYGGVWVWPVTGPLVGSFSGHGLNGSGINLAGQSGETVVAAHAGRVVYVGSGLPGYGRLIIIRNDPEYLSAYAFNRKIIVQEGMIVQAGQPIARMGVRHGQALLHFEIRRDGVPINPLTLLPRR
jgi:lipoprotein NlpD